MKFALLITAAGSSTRMGSDKKKEYAIIQTETTDGTVLSICLKAFLDTAMFNPIVITIPQGHQEFAQKALFTHTPQLLDTPEQICFTTGGSTRQQSVLNGLLQLERLAQEKKQIIDYVLVHDGARPWVSQTIIQDILATVQKHGAAVPVIPAIDTMKEVDASGNITRHLERKNLFSVQTPQAFEFSKLLAAHQKAQNDGREYTDDAEIWAQYEGAVHTCAGHPSNKKITHPQDLQKLPDGRDNTR